ncbi:MAG: recombination-associated protein RdgC [Xanthomonadales bacterium]|nr:Recombination-associated protein RdgC [Xanthomonadales bacterium]MCC6592563.1 recombination-associated protein RdgC [Xanthomonadales bacterium]
MWFKNLSLLRLPPDFALDATQLEEALAASPLRSPGPLEPETRGFLSPFSREDAGYTHGSGDALLFCLGQEARLLPSSVLRDAVSARIAEHEAKTGRKPGKRLRNEFREAALGELLPRAFIRRTRVGAYWDGPTRLLAVDSGSDRGAEAVATALREALGSFPARPLATEASIALLLSEWLVSGQLPAGFELGDECELKDPSDQVSVVRCRHHDLSADEVREHARCGKQVTQLGLVYEGRIGFVLDTKAKLRKLKFLDIIADQLDRQDGADEETVLDAEFALMSLELRRLYTRLDDVLRFVD